MKNKNILEEELKEMNLRFARSITPYKFDWMKFWDIAAVVGEMIFVILMGSVGLLVLLMINQ